MQHLPAVIATFFVLAPIACFAFSYTPLGRAIIDRMRSREREPDDRFADVIEELQRLQDQLSDQSQRMDELHDRLDFAERLLSRGSPAPEASPEVATPT